MLFVPLPPSICLVGNLETVEDVVVPSTTSPVIGMHLDITGSLRRGVGERFFFIVSTVCPLPILHTIQCQGQS